MAHLAPIRSLLIANRGEIACRIARTARRLGLRTIAVFSDADRMADHVLACDEAVHIGPSEARQSYLSVPRILDAARQTGVDAIHPGYGFLAEDEAFAAACTKAGLRFIGPSPEAIHAMGSKLNARRLARECGLDVVPGYDGDDQRPAELAARAAQIGYPVMIKASAGGGGKGIRIVEDPADFAEHLEMAQREARNAFGDDRVVLERFIPDGRHIEVQVLGDQHGAVVHLFDRECSLQRRHQKVVEEAPAPRLPETLRARLLEDSVRLARSIGYTSLGTVEYLVSESQNAAFFLEMNTRIQVEHPVTEMITGLDLVEQQIRVAENRPLPFTQDDIQPRGHAFELRLNAEHPERGFLPSIGTIARLAVPTTTLDGARLRLDTGFSDGSTVSPYYDSMLAKLIVWGEDRDSARAALAHSLGGLTVAGLDTNRDYLARLIDEPVVREARATTRFLDSYFPWEAEPAAPPAERLLIAAAASVALARESRLAERPLATPWQSLGGWRLLESAGQFAASRILLADSSGGRHALRVAGRKGQYVITPEDGTPRAVQIRRGQDGRLGLMLDDEVFSAEVTITGKDLLIRLGPDSCQLTVVDDTASSLGEGSAAQSSGALVAPIPGLILEVLVAEGDLVEANQPLIVLEAMKMIHRLSATGGGRVSRISCAVGDTTAIGSELVMISEAEHV